MCFQLPLLERSSSAASCVHHTLISVWCTQEAATLPAQTPTYRDLDYSVRRPRPTLPDLQLEP